MFRLFTHSSCVFAIALLFVTCNPQVRKVPDVEMVPDQPVRIIKGDTLHYQIAFTDTRERERFVYSFNRFIKDETFNAERFDSAGVYTAFKILPAAVAAGNPEKQASEPAPLFSDKQVTPEEPPEPVVAPSVEQPPEFGGSLRLYTPRASFDYPLSALVNAYPFSESNGNDSTAGYFSVSQTSSTTLLVKCRGKLTNGAGQIVTVMDVISNWTLFIKEHPAEGLSLFRSCDGIVPFIKGEEAVVRGFVALDDKTIKIRLRGPDPDALDRLRNIRTLSAAFKLGPYFIKSSREQETILSAFRTSAGNKPFLNELVVRQGGDNNPNLSFSLGRYDAVMLCGTADLEYARRNLLKNGTCSIAAHDRYFVSCALSDSGARSLVRSLLSGALILKNFVKAEGAPIAALESDGTGINEPPAIAGALKPVSAEPLKILFRKDDAISKIIAERLLAGLSQKGVQGSLIAADTKGYESALVGKSFGCAVGWVPGTILTDKSEKLRLATMYFSSDTDETARIAQNLEIPLFSIDWYLVAKDKVGLFKGTLAGLYAKDDRK